MKRSHRIAANCQQILEIKEFNCSPLRRDNARASLQRRSPHWATAAQSMLVVPLLRLGIMPVS
jgi:hypothetical protein